MNLQALRGFIGKAQSATLQELSSGEEGAYFLEVVEKLAKLIAETPQTHGSPLRGDARLATLHYFVRGYDFYLIEKDMGCPSDGPEDFQSQAYGLVFMNGHSEIGYVSLPEIAGQCRRT